MKLSALPYLLLATLTAPALAADGALDPTFHGGQPVTVDFLGQGAGAKAVAAEGGGRIVFAGNTAIGALNSDFAIGRLLPSGALDASFGGDGRVVVPFDLQPFNFDGAEGVAILPDGRVVAAGPVTGPAGGPPVVCGVVRLETDGDLDPTFGGDGRVTFAFTTDPGDPTETADETRCVALALQPDGKILVAGTAVLDDPPDGYHDAFVARLETDGDLDTTFISLVPGFWYSQGPGTNEGHALRLAPNGTIWVAGASGTSISDNDFALFRVLANGSPDGAYGTGGEVSFESGGPFPDAEEVLYAIDLAQNGDVVVGGRVGPVAEVPHCFVGRRSPAGTFVAAGWFEGLTDCAIEGLALQSDGLIVTAARLPNVGAADEGNFLIRRESPLGGSDGFYARTVDFSPGVNDDGDLSYAVALSGGRPVVVGTVDSGTVQVAGIVRLQTELVFRDGFESGNKSAWSF